MVREELSGPRRRCLMERLWSEKGDAAPGVYARRVRRNLNRGSYGQIDRNGGVMVEFLMFFLSMYGLVKLLDAFE